MEPRVPEHLAGTILPIKVTWLRFRSRQVMGWRLVDVRYWHKADMTAAFVNVRFQDKRGHRADLPPVRRNVEPERNGQR